MCTWITRFLFRKHCRQVANWVERNYHTEIQHGKQNIYLFNISVLFFRLMVVLLVVLFVVVGPTFIYGQTHSPSGTAAQQNQWTDFWMFRLLLNLIGYCTIIVPGYLLIQYIRKSGYLDRAGWYTPHTRMLRKASILAKASWNKCQLKCCSKKLQF